MNSPEAFYLHISGTQRGPYTIPQVDHLLNSGLIARETLYWREGLDQWQPVTDLIALRKKPKPWVRPVLAFALLLALAVPARIFGPVVLEGWREANQHEFTAPAAYWRARDVVRTQVLQAGAMVAFDGVATAKMDMHAPGAAEVTLGGAVTDAGRITRRAVWKVAMTYDAEAKQWSGQPLKPAAP